MAFGVSAYLANKILDHLNGISTWTPPSSIYAQLQTGDPGANGILFPSAGSATRVAASYNAAVGGAASLASNLGPWTNGGTSEVLLGISYWDALTGGNFLWSAPVPTRPWNPGDTLTYSQATNSFGPLAA